jgi:DNA-binding LytR/AlgR family response regulator
MEPARILIVEDEFIISEKLSHDLAGIGYTVLGVADSGEEALKTARETRPDLVIMDITLDGELDGIETARLMNKEVVVPVIYLTGHSGQNFFERAKITHPAAYLSKPYNRSDIYHAIELALFPAGQAGGSNPPAEAPACIFNDRIFVKDNKNCFNKVDIADILWIQGDGSYCTIHTVAGKYKTTHNLKMIENKIKNPKLARIHRSYLVNLSRVKQVVGRQHVVLDVSVPGATGKAEEVIQIGPEYRDNIHKIIKLI